MGVTDMEGKRFGFGLAVGLLLGVAIITASGGLGALSPGVPQYYNFSKGATTTTYTGTTAVTSSQPIDAAVGHQTTTTTIAASQTIPGNSSNTGLNGMSSGVTTPAYSSRVESIPHQPLLIDALVFVPVLVAFLLGAVLYRASYRNREHPDEERP